MSADHDMMLASLRPLVSGDGLNLEALRFDPMSGILKLRLFQPGEGCAACRMSVELLEEIDLPIAKRANPTVRRVVIVDDRPEQSS